ncbi:MAG: hypothetical protein ACYTG7_07765, partial [Planctomycetota bacterium]
SPDQAGTFGSKSAMVIGGATFPVTMTAGDTLTILEDGAALPPVTFVGGTFTAQEIATEINNQTGLDLASVVDGKLVVEATSEGTASTLQIQNTVGTPADTLGLSTALETGADLGVNVEIGGLYSGDENTNWQFEASGSGTIGVTPGLTVSVYDDSGALVEVLNVGEGYSPGDKLEVAHGVTVSFTSGDISDTAGDFFNLLVLNDSDTSGILASLGMNTFFSGSTASNIAVRETLIDDPSLIATAQSNDPGDNNNVLQMALLQDTPLSGLGDSTPIDFYSSTMGALGLDKKWTDDMLEIQEILIANLENERASISGVSIDEELLNIEKFQQMLQAASRYLTVVNETQGTLMNII